MNRYTRVVLACIVILLFGAAGTATGAGETSVSLIPATDEATTESSTTVEVVVENASNGVGAINATISLSTDGVATISDVTLDDSAASVDIDTNAANTSAIITGYGLNTSDFGQIVVGTVTLQGESTGETDVVLQMNALGDESGIDYTVNSTTMTSILISSPSEGGRGGGGGSNTTRTATTTTAAPTTTATTKTTATTTTTDDPIATTVPENTGSEAPGFGPVVTLAALFSMMLLALRRRST